MKRQGGAAYRELIQLRFNREVNDGTTVRSSPVRSSVKDDDVRIEDHQALPIQDRTNRLNRMSCSAAAFIDQLAAAPGYRVFVKQRTSTDMASLPPILVTHLFRDITQRLVTLLRSLDADEWHQPTVSSQRQVKDIASHLLDGSLRRLSMQRDRYFPQDGSSQPRENETLLGFLTRLNTEWEVATRRLSPPVIVSMIEWADEQMINLFESADPYGPAIFPVAWAGEQQSMNWMDVARDYTEKWHHTQQIFEATERPSTITERRLFYPCLDIFMRALPFTFHNVDVPEGTGVGITIRGDAGGKWFVTRSAQGWTQVLEATGKPTANVTLTQDSAWKLFTKRLDHATALRRFPDIQIEGDDDLCRHVIEMVSVMA